VLSDNLKFRKRCCILHYIVVISKILLILFLINLILESEVNGSDDYALEV